MPNVQRKMKHPLFPFLLGLALSTLAAQALPTDTDEAGPTTSDATVLINWLLQDERNLDGLSFAKVVHAATGRQVLPVSPENEADQRLIVAIRTAMGQVLQDIESPEHPIHQVPRINEVSGHLEDLILARLDALNGVSCTFPVNASGNPQRSGYPDMRLLDETSGRIFYLDPKLYRDTSETSTFRTFYYEPKTATNKILDDASHLIIGLPHAGRVDGRWHITGWKLVDLYTFQVRLKAEFQASNRDLYRPEAIIETSSPD